jgi:hypothetical protein
MTAIFYDTEFIDTGTTIDLISIGMVTENGDEYYAIIDDHEVITRAMRHDWLRKNVVPSLPITDAHQDTETTVWFACPTPEAAPANCWFWNEDHPDYRHVKPREQIAKEVRQFIAAAPDPHLWAWYAAYDHVALAQLFGTMMQLPVGIPMWTADLRQEVERLGNPQLPEQPAGEHNALEDARHNLVRWAHLKYFEVPGV